MFFSKRFQIATLSSDHTKIHTSASDGRKRSDRRTEALECARETVSSFGMGKRAKGGGVGGKQSSLLASFDFSKYPQLKKPLEVVGKTIDVPGNFWDKCPAADKERFFKCTIRDYLIAHRFVVGPISPAFQLQEMGERGTGSLEQGDSSGED